MASEAHTLHVRIVQAEGLHHLNKHCKDGLYVTCEVNHHDKRAKATKAQTHPVNCQDDPNAPGALNPVWNQEFQLHPWYMDENIVFSVMDKGLLGSRQEGDKIELPAEYFYPQPFEGTIPIQGLEHANLFVVIEVLGSQGNQVAMQEQQQPAYDQAQQEHYQQQYYHEQQAAPQAAPQQQLQVEQPAPITAVGPPQRLQVQIVSATGLKHLNFTGDNPFCTCEVLHADQHAKATKVQTKTSKGLDPQWNESHIIDPWHVGEPLVFTVSDKGMLTSRLEGKAELPSEYIDPHGFEGEVPLEGLPHATVYVQVLPAGPSQGGAPAAAVAQQAPAYAPAHVPTNAPAQGGQVDAQKLKVTFYHANGLKHLNHTGDNPFVTCEVQHLQRRAKPATIQSKPCPKTLNPVWNETLTLQPYVAGESLLFTLHDKGLLGSKLEGKVELAADHFYQGFDGELPIQGLPHAFMHVRVEPIGPADADPTSALAAQADQTKYPMGVSFPYAASPHAAVPSQYAVTQQPSYPYQQAQQLAPQYSYPTVSNAAPVTYTGTPTYAQYPYTMGAA